MNLQLDGADAPQALWPDLDGPLRLTQSSCEICLPGPALLEPPALAVVLLGHREELRDALCLIRFWEIDRWRFFMEELAAMVTTQG